MPSLPAPTPSTLSAHDAAVSQLIAMCPNDETPCRPAYTPPALTSAWTPHTTPQLKLHSTSALRGHATINARIRPRAAPCPRRSTIDHRPLTIDDSTHHCVHAPIQCHPCTCPVITGRGDPQERFIEWVNTHADVQWVRMIDMANEFRARVAPPAGARMPRGFTAPGATGSEQ